MKKIFLILNILIIVLHVYGQDIGVILQQSKDITLRQSIVDSIVKESFWAMNANYMRWYSNLYHKEDFSEFAKRTLLNYFERRLSDIEIDKIKTEVKKRVDRDSVIYKSEAVKKNIAFDDYYIEILNREINKDIKVMSEHAIKQVSPLYARLLGWLDYKPAIPVLESILQDSLMNGYAKENNTELALSCKLALARMGLKKYENELINDYKKIELDCSQPDFYNPLKDLFYINTINSINQVIKFSENDRIYQGVHPDNDKGIVIPPCTAKSAILLYLSSVIENYPLEYMFGDKVDFYFADVVLWADEEFYKKQMLTLEKWLKNNKNNYRINTERFF
jgi:hypothetical protein